MSDEPLFQHIDDQEASDTLQPAPADATDPTGTHVPATGFLPGGMGGSAAVSGIPGVVPPGTVQADDELDTNETSRSS